MSTALKTLKSQGGGDRETVFPRRDSEVGFNLLGRVISLLIKEPEYVANARVDRANYKGGAVPSISGGVSVPWREVSGKGEAVPSISGGVSVPGREVSGREVVGSGHKQLVPKDVSI